MRKVSEMNLRKFEFWLVTSCLITYLLLLAYQGITEPSVNFFDNPFDVEVGNEESFDYYKHLMLPRFMKVIACYVVFLFLNYKTFPSLQAGNPPYSPIINILTSGLFLMGTFYFASYLSNTHFFIRSAVNKIASASWLKSAFSFSVLVLLAIGSYYIVKTFVQWIHNEHLAGKKEEQKILREITVAAMLWMGLSAVMLILSNGHLGAVQFFFIYEIPVFILFFFLWVYRIIPRYKQHGKKRKVFIPSFFLLLVSQLPMMFYFIAVRFHQEEIIMLLFISATIIPAFIIWPLSKYYYNIRQEQQSKVHTLETAVSTSSANLDFLRSQINPHFLFNALNTIYGTALQENADRTAEGVQKLGDMMRFMLKEDQHEKIALEEEITYLQHYIDLQKLRTEQSPDIDINFTVHEQDCDHQIAPMLLIPFVENAFKHGISLKERSWIRINLSCDAQHVYFDAYNSIHRKDESDPEKDRSGIGLENVKQRLNLLYPQHHALNIRQTPDEFFVHLTITTR